MSDEWKVMSKEDGVLDASRSSLITHHF